MNHQVQKKIKLLFHFLQKLLDEGAINVTYDFWQFDTPYNPLPEHQRNEDSKERLEEEARSSITCHSVENSLEK